LLEVNLDGSYSPAAGSLGFEMIDIELFLVFLNADHPVGAAPPPQR